MAALGLRRGTVLQACTQQRRRLNSMLATAPGGCADTTAGSAGQLRAGNHAWHTRSLTVVQQHSDQARSIMQPS